MKEAESSHKVQQDQKKFICLICGMKFHYKSILQKHLKVRHDGAKIYTIKPQNFKCSMCDNGFTTAKYLSKHIEGMHTNKEKIRCLICDRSFKQKDTMNRHVAFVHGDSVTKAKITCIKCSKKFTHHSELYQHMTVDHGEENKLFCTVCCKTFSGHQSLKKHVQTVHEKLKPFQCSKCPKAFSLKWIQEVHLKDVHLGIKAHKCNICGREFAQKTALRGHVRVVHQKFIKYVCHLCGKNFAYRGNFEDHTRRKHSLEKRDTEKRYQCPYCDFKCFSPVDFKSHILKDHEQKTADFLSCKVCQQLFISKLGLRNHVKNIHMHTIPNNETFVQEQTNNTNELEVHSNLSQKSQLLNFEITRLKCHICKTKFNNSEIFECHTATAHNASKTLNAQ